jgi:xylulokinase
MTEHFLGIDVGTTATKAVVLDGNGQVLRRVRSPHLSALPVGPGRVDPTSWWASVEDACQALNLGQNFPLKAIGLSVHSPVAVPMDTSGKHVSAGFRFETPELIEVVQAVRDQLSREEMRWVGNRITPATFMSAAYTLLQQKEPAAVQELAMLGAVGTYIGHRLTGEAVIDPTQASYFGLFNSVNDWEWMETLAVRLRIPVGILPPIRHSLSPLGVLTADAASTLRLPSGTPVIVGAGDTACAAFAVKLESTHDRLFTLGTTHVVTDQGSSPAQDNLHLQRASIRRGSWLRHGVINGGLALATGARLLGYGAGPNAVPDMVEVARSASPEDLADAPFFIPHVRAERGPFWMESPVSALTGLTADTGRAAAAWSIVEGVLFADRLVAGSFDDATDKGLLLAGDLGGQQTFSQFVADAFGIEVRLSDESHLPAVGAAMMAAEVHGTQTMPAVRVTDKIVPRDEYRKVIAHRWPQFIKVRSRYLQEASQDRRTTTGM